MTRCLTTSILIIFHKEPCYLFITDHIHHVAIILPLCLRTLEAWVQTSISVSTQRTRTPCLRSIAPIEPEYPRIMTFHVSGRHLIAMRKLGSFVTRLQQSGSCNREHLLNLSCLSMNDIDISAFEFFGNILRYVITHYLKPYGSILNVSIWNGFHEAGTART